MRHRIISPIYNREESGTTGKPAVEGWVTTRRDVIVAASAQSCNSTYLPGHELATSG